MILTGLIKLFGMSLQYGGHLWLCVFCSYFVGQTEEMYSLTWPVIVGYDRLCYNIKVNVSDPL
jgi:hypothetical protein